MSKLFLKKQGCLPTTTGRGNGLRNIYFPWGLGGRKEKMGFYSLYCQGLCYAEKQFIFSSTTLLGQAMIPTLFV